MALNGFQIVVALEAQEEEPLADIFHRGTQLATVRANDVTLYDSSRRVPLTDFLAALVDARAQLRSPTIAHEALEEWERLLLNRLVVEAGEHAPALARQVERASVAERFTPHDAWWVTLEVPAEVPPVAMPERVPVDATAADLDGADIEVLLHLDGGRIRTLEIYRADGAALAESPPTSLLATLRPRSYRHE